MREHSILRQQRRPSPKSPAPVHFLTALFALIATLSLSGCVGLTGAGTPAATTNSSGNSGTLAASATSVSFGSVDVGSSASQTLTLTNSGTVPVVISQATITGTGFSIPGGVSSVTIDAGQSHAFQIQFAPQATGTINGSVAVTSNASNASLSVALTGTASSS
ncbi:MAG: choice-of-anchor D domain-containing protein, partial [Candidatus Acidiferrales bacterium]